MRTTILSLTALLLVSSTSWAGWCPLSDRACGIQGLPSSVVEGIIRVESGGHPWALHVGIGNGYTFYPKSPAEARRILAVALALTDNVDIGLMQVNWRTWREMVRGLGLDAYDLLDAQVNMELTRFRGQFMAWHSSRLLVALEGWVRSPLAGQVEAVLSWPVRRERRCRRLSALLPQATIADGFGGCPGGVQQTARRPRGGMPQPRGQGLNSRTVRGS